MNYKVIYCAEIKDEKHKGLLKIGDTDFTPTRAISSYAPNDPELCKAADSRIKEWNGTGAGGAVRVYCDVLLRYNAISENNETFRDHEVHAIIQSVGGRQIIFDSKLDSGREWFETDLGTVIAAIKAAREGRDYLDTSEIPNREIWSLREEQEDAVKDTVKRFNKASDMLWYAKMRFGKTITALNLVKRMGYKRTIIITHRPVVEDGWGSDFYHVFSQEDAYAFLTKISESGASFSVDETDEAIDRKNENRLRALVESGRNFVYFASIQDLRGSKEVGGKFDKNAVVFNTHWDLVIIDEAHEGTTTTLGQTVIDRLVKDGTKRLDLSGTPFNLFGGYSDSASVYTWDYVMEQERKAQWAEKHPGEPNPYNMPTMHINTYDLQNALRGKDLDLSDKTFSFREFFRTWTGDLSRDGADIPEGVEKGSFVHPEDVKHFLDLLSLSDEASRFPYATKEGCSQNVHTLWMVPGVKEAAALSKMLRQHPFFRNFGIANVAGEGDHDEERNYSNALELVRKVIQDYPCSITLSCGRLTTGVTVKEWSSVFMLSGSDDTDAKQYMQTIFRVQSGGTINGVEKTDCYVYDFAPDRALSVIAETVGTRKSGRGGTAVRDDEQYENFEKFLKYCPVIAIDGAEFKDFKVQDLMSQINRVYIGRALRTGFMDNCIYDAGKFTALSDAELKKLDAIFKKLPETKKKAPLSKAGMASSGLGKGKQGKKSGEKEKTGKKTEKQEQKTLESELRERLRTVSIRIPLLFYGGDFEIEEGRLSEIITGIDDESWAVFMPEKLTKADFRTLVGYYNQETVIGAGKAIREKAHAADALLPTERVIAISEIFSHFHNPAKETVLTPWRVVNMHMADTLGGYCFFNEQYEENDEEYYRRLHEPRFVDQGNVTADTLANPNARIMEMNSKSGLYPLYVTYSLYRAKLKALGKTEAECLPETLLSVWDEAVSQVYVLCQSPMAVSITNRTLLGYRTGSSKAIYIKKLLEKMKDKQKLANKLTNPETWSEEGERMKFDAIVGNPPYQEMDGGNKASAVPIYHQFVQQAKAVNPNYISMIMPARWYSGGRGLDSFRSEMLQDSHIQKLVDFIDSNDCFAGVDIAGGLCYLLWSASYSGDCTVTNVEGETRYTTKRNLNEHEVFIRYGQALSVVKKVQKQEERFLEAIVSSQRPFGLRTYVTPTEEGELQLRYNQGIGPYKRDLVTAGLDWIDKWKVMMSYLTSDHAGRGDKDGKRKIFSSLEILPPNTVCTETYIIVGTYETEEEAKNLESYLKTRFCRFLVSLVTTTQHIAKSSFMLVPVQDFSKPWTDAELYAKYGLTEDEIAFIEGTIRAME